jgi:hypothetical protein
MAKAIARIRNIISACAGALAIVALAAAAHQQQPDPPTTSAATPAQKPPAGTTKPRAPEKPPQPPPPQTLTEALLREIAALHVQLDDVRVELAQARLDAQTAQRELAELRQFVIDHQQFGDDFQLYKGVKDIAEREARQRENEQGRQQREAEKAQREAERSAARAEREQQNALADRVAGYKRLGFTHLGLDVYASKMAFYYNTKDTGGGGVRVDYDTLLGDYLRPFPQFTEVDYSKMTISGSVLNASEVVRNVGVAITFFDENGNQVGHETVQINNARPDVPYPFTSTIEMALNRPFDSSSTYVMYADQVPVE